MNLRDVAIGFGAATGLCAAGWILASRASAASPTAVPRPRREIVVPARHGATDQQEPGASVHDAMSRTARQERLGQMRLNPESLASFVRRYRGYTRERLLAEGLLAAGSAEKGGPALGPEQRTAAGNALLERAKDILYGLLFGDEHCQVRFDRVERELLTLTLPRAKARAVGFMQAATELSAAGTWRDPQMVSNDERADNVIIEVEYGEAADESVGDGIVTALALINNLEVNEQVLYARMTNVEQSTLIE